VVLSEGRDHGVQITGVQIHCDWGVGAIVTQVRAWDDGELIFRNALIFDLGLGVCCKTLRQLFQSGEVVGVKGFDDCLLTGGADIRKAHAVSRENAGEWVDDHGFHAEAVCHHTGALAASTAEAGEGVFGDIIAALNGDLLDGVGHVLNGDLLEAFSDFLAGAAIADFSSQCVEGVFDFFDCQRLVLVRAEDFREVVSVELGCHDVGVGDSERAAAAVTFWTRVCSSGIWTNLEATVFVMEDGTTTRSNGVDHHHWRAHANASHFSLKRALKLAVEVGHICGGTAHVEADELFEACHFGGFNCAYNTTSRAGEDCVFALEEGGISQTAGGLHEHEAAVGVLDVELAGHLINVATQDWGEVCVNNGGVTTAH